MPITHVPITPSVKSPAIRSVGAWTLSKNRRSPSITAGNTTAKTGRPVARSMNTSDTIGTRLAMTSASTARCEAASAVPQG